jgi:hypothetical protein
MWPTSETRPVSLTYGNIVRFTTQGNDGAETARGGWGERIRTSAFHHFIPLMCENFWLLGTSAERRPKRGPAGLD